MKKFLVLITVLLLTFTLSGCGEEDDSWKLAIEKNNEVKIIYTEDNGYTILRRYKDENDEWIVRHDKLDFYTEDQVDDIVYREVNRAINNFEDDEFQDLINYVLMLEEGIDYLDFEIEFIEFYMDFLDEYHDMYLAMNDDNTMLIDNEDDLTEQFRALALATWPEWFDEDSFEYEPEFIIVSDYGYTITVEYYEGTFIAIINEITVCKDDTCEVIEEWVQTDYVVTREELYTMFLAYLETLDAMSGFH